MVCRSGGSNQTSQPRQLLTLTDDATTGTTISIAHVVQYELVMEQWTAHVSAVPTTVLNGEITLSYIHRSDTKQDTLLRSVNFADLAVQDLVCISPFRWKPGDTIEIVYSNVDLLDVGTQFMGIEIIP